MGHLEQEVLAEAWILFKETGRIDHRNRLVLHYTSLVRYIAAKVGERLPAMVDREDLVSYGMFGLMDAIEKFDIDKGVKFETYAVTRIRGAIIDEIRTLDWVPRSVRTKARDIEKARDETEQLLGRPATHEEVAQTLGLPMSDYWRLRSDAFVEPVETYGGLVAPGIDDSVRPDYYERPLIDPVSNPEDLFQVDEIVDQLGEAIAGMDERSKTILALYYFQEMTLSEIGSVLGVTESRVCQLQSKVLHSLGESLGHGGLVAVA